MALPPSRKRSGAGQLATPFSLEKQGRADRYPLLAREAGKGGSTRMRSRVAQEINDLSKASYKTRSTL